MKNFLLIISISLISNTVYCQRDSILIPFENTQHQLNQKGMFILSSWGGANLVSGIIGYGISEKFEDQQFHLMNAAWGAVNLSIAAPSLFRKPQRAESNYELLQKQTSFEKIFLANALLDVVYISGGTYLTQMSKNQTDYKLKARLNAYGNSIIIQGAGLLLFDSFMTILHNKNRKHKLDPFMKKAHFNFSFNSVSLQYKLY